MNAGEVFEADDDIIERFALEHSLKEYQNPIRTVQPGDEQKYSEKEDIEFACHTIVGATLKHPGLPSCHREGGDLTDFFTLYCSLLTIFASRSNSTSLSHQEPNFETTTRTVHYIDFLSLMPNSSNQQIASVNAVSKPIGDK